MKWPKNRLFLLRKYAAMAGWRWTIAKKKKKTWLKRLKAVNQKTKFGPKYKWSKISYLKLFVLKIFFQAYNFFIFFHTSQCPSGHLQSFVCPESVKASKNYRKKSIILQYSFIQKASLILRTSTHIENNMVLQHSQNLSEFTKNFPVNMLVWCQKKHLHPTVSRRPKLHSWSTLKANVRLFLYISVRKDVVRFYLMEGRLGEAE